MKEQLEKEARIRKEAVRHLLDSGLLNEKMSVTDVLKASRTIDPGTVGWTVVYDSDNWAVVVP